MRNLWLLTILIVALVFSSGCTQDVWKLLGFNLKKDNVVELNDILVVEDKNSFPASPVLPNSPVKLTYVIENKDPDKSVQSVGTDIFDACMFEVTAGGFSGETIFPRGSKYVKFELMAPTREEIGNIKHICDVKFYVDYDFSGNTLYDIVTINPEEIEQMQQAGKKVTLHVMKGLGSGPIKLDAQVLGVGEGVIGGQEIPFEFIVSNRGKGILKDNIISSRDVHIFFPKDMVGSCNNIDTENSAGSFSCGSSGADCECTNQESIEIFKGESSPIIFRVTTTIPEKQRTHTVRANFDYTYELRDSHKIEVRPYG